MCGSYVMPRFDTVDRSADDPVVRDAGPSEIEGAADSDSRSNQSGDVPSQIPLSRGTRYARTCARSAGIAAFASCVPNSLALDAELKCTYTTSPGAGNRACAFVARRGSDFWTSICTSCSGRAGLEL